MKIYVEVKFKEMIKIINKGLRKKIKFSNRILKRILDYLEVKKGYRQELINLAKGYISVK